MTAQHARPPRVPPALAGPAAAVLVVAAVLAVVLATRDGDGAPERLAAPAPTSTPTPTPTPEAVPPPPPPPPPAGPREVRAFSLRVGECLPAEPAEAASLTVTVVPCAEPHGAEVYATFALPGAPADPFPGEELATAQAVAGCETRFGPFVGLPYDDSGFDYFFYKPDAATWETLDDRAVTCVLTADARTGTAQGSRF